jgi:hypothetical protein
MLKSGFIEMKMVGINCFYKKGALFVILIASFSSCQICLKLPKNKSNYTLAEQISRWKHLSFAEREDTLVSEVLKGNIPEFLRAYHKISFTEDIDGKNYKVEILVLPDYFAIGSEKAYFYISITPMTAQKIADYLHCTLPTKKMVDIIWKNSELKFNPQPIPPSDSMTSLSIMWQHNNIVRSQSDSLTSINNISLSALKSGHKKDVVISNRNMPGKVHIYGWHRKDGTPIQPLYSGHTQTWVDYSHGIRLVYKWVKVNNKKMKISDVLKHQELHDLLSDEGVFK